MSVFNDKKSKKGFAFVEDKSIDLKDTPKSLDELKKAGRGGSQKAQNSSKKAGRPKLDESEKKNYPCTVFFSKEQKELLEQRAKKSNLSMSKYIMIKLFGVE